MPRANLDTTLAADMASPSFSPVALAKLAFRSKTVYYWNGRGSLTWNGMTFEGIGTLGKLGAVGSGSADVVESGTSLEASGLDTNLLGESLTDVQMGAPATIWLGSWLNGVLHGTPYQLWQGGMGQPIVSADPQHFSIVLTLQTRMAQLSRATARRYTAADQRLYYPDDSGLAWVEILNDIALIWGQAN
jgi:hypothetical protein